MVQPSLSSMNLKGKDVFKGSAFISTVLFIYLIAKFMLCNFVMYRHVTHQDGMLSVDSYMTVAIACNWGLYKFTW